MILQVTVKKKKNWVETKVKTHKNLSFSEINHTKLKWIEIHLKKIITQHLIYRKKWQCFVFKNFKALLKILHKK